MAHGGAHRLSARAVLGGFGLLALVVTLGIMVMLALRVLDETPGAIITDERPLLDEVGRAAQVDHTADSGRAPSVPTAAGQQAVCETNRSTLELASSAFSTLHGTAPVDQAALVAAGLLDDEITTHELEPSGAAVVIVGVGVCATP